jgi:hypothetical protein
MARTRYGDLRDTFHVSRFTNNGLLRQADFFSILLARDLSLISNLGKLGSL